MIKSYLSPALWGGILIFLTTTVPGVNLVNCACGAGIIASGAFALFLHRKHLGPAVKIGVDQGVLLGLLSGLIGAVLSISVSFIAWRFFRQMSFQSTIESFGVGWNDLPLFLDPLILSRYAVPLFFALVVLTDILLATIGGLIGAIIWGQAVETVYGVEQSASKSSMDDDGIVVEKNSHF